MHIHCSALSKSMQQSQLHNMLISTTWHKECFTSDSTSLCTSYVCMSTCCMSFCCMLYCCIQMGIIRNHWHTCTQTCMHGHIPHVFTHAHRQCLIDILRLSCAWMCVFQGPIVTGICIARTIINHNDSSR